ncbi:MAG: M56 family metallopeptidase [Bacteroidales bacterium]|nr:M56 family metallopeptidase [Bacteroidales bacterium]
MVGTGEEPASQTAQIAFPWEEVLLLYVAGAVITLILFLRSAVKMSRFIRNGKPTQREGCRVVIMEQDMPSFSWKRTVVISRKDLQDNPAIFTHELMHVRCRHSLDLLLGLPIQILFWWNPLVWIAREELRLVHEYQADEGVIDNGIDATQYQLLLVRKAVGEQRFMLASGFQHAKLKNRITMMLKSTSSSWMRWSYLVLIPLLASVMYACNPTKNNKAKDPEAQEQAAPETKADIQEPMSYSDIEVKPTFQGGDENGFAKWVNSHLRYPEQAKNDQTQGRVVVQFTIGSDGVVRDAQVLQGVREDLDAETIRVISSSPTWEPGMQDGKAVPVSFVIPVVYKLR